MDPPRIENPLPNVCVRAGEPLKLECQVAGTRPTLVWLHNSRNLADARDVQIRFSESIGLCSVEIREVFSRHAGIYTLLARNASGETYTSCNVTLASRPPPETSDSDLTSDIELSKPVVRQALRDQNVVEGDSACLQCTITGVPEPEVIWYHNSKPIKESRDYKFLFEGDRCSLVIPSVTKNHQGSYRCKALNPAGETSSSCRVKVTPSPPTMEIAAAGSASSLRISRLLSDVNCRHGDRFKLIIEIEGCNEPEVIWSFQGRPILLDQDFVFDQIGKSYILEIPKATLDHAGTYSVEARDPTGSRHSSCRVIVDPPPQSSLALIQAAGGGSDVVSTHVTKSFVSSKKTMLMQKVSASKSEATTGGQTVHSEEHQAATTEKHGYEKMGDNAPQEYHSKESFGFDRLGSNPPQHYHTKEVRDNRIEGQQTQLAIEGKAAEGTQASVLPVTELAAQAVNITTRVSEPRQVSILQRSGSAHIAPKFTKPVASVAVFEGEPLKLEGWFTGHPEPIVKWSRGSTTLSNKAELQLTIKEGYTSLAIPRAMLKDYARYTCVISNDVGSSSSAADVVVQTKREAPQFTRRLAARVYRTGSDITLEVEVSGQPQPEVKWLRDEQDLKAINRYKIQSSGNIHTLKMRNVTGADSGRITVLATNVAGEAQSIADIFVEDDASTDEEREVSIRDYHIEDEKKMEVTVVQAEHLHRENTVLIERNVTPKPKVLALPAPTPQPQEPPKQLPMPVGTPTQTDEDSRMRTSVDERIEKHVHTSQNILKRQQQFIKQNTTETSRFTPTPPPESPKPRIEAPITPAGSPLPPAEQPKPTKQSPPAAAPSPPPPPVRAPTPPRKEPKSVPRPVVPQHVEKLPLIPKAVPDPPAQSHIVQRDSVQTIQQQTQMTRKEELRTVISHQYQQEHFGLRTTEPNPRDSPRPVRTSSPPPPTPELPPVNSQIMAERKVEQRSRTIEFVAPPSPLLPKELPGPPPGIPGAKPKRLPTVEALAPLPPVQPKVKALPEKQAAFIRSPTPVLVRPIVAPPTPPPPPIVKPIVAPPPQRRPPPPPQFKDELLTYEQIRRQEEERIQKHCRKITLIEQRERQTQRRENQTHIGTVSLTKTPVPLDPPDVRLKPIECKMVTEIIEPPKPQNLEEAVSEFYKVHDETTRRVRTIVRQEVRTQSLPPQNIPVVSVQSLTFPPPPPPPKRSPEPMCHVEKKESHRFQQTRDFRSISPVLLQKSLHKEPRAPSPTPMCAIQEIDLLKQKTTQQKDPVDILNFTSTVTRQKYSPEPVQYVDLRERRSVPPPSTTPLCHLQEIDHRLTGVDRVDTTLLVEMTEKQKHTKAAQSMELGNKYLSIDETNQTTRVPSEPVRFCVREQTSRSINTKQKQQNSLVSSTLSSTNNTPVHWSRRCRSVDRNVLLTETTRERKDAVDLVNKSWLSERRSVPRNPPPSSATVYIDQHTKVITAPPVLPVQNLPVLPIVRRSDQISTVSVGVSDERPSWQPIAPSLVEGRYSFRGVTDSKVSADTSLVRIETSTVPAPPSTARRDELRQVHPQEPLYRTFPAKNSATKPAVPLVDYLTLHQLEGRSSNMARNWSEQNAYLEQRSYRSTDIEKSMTGTVPKFTHTAGRRLPISDPGMVVSPPVSAGRRQPPSYMMTPPVFTRQPTGGRFIEGRDARFDAVVSGEPMPQLVWSRRGLPIRNDHKRETDYNAVTGETYLLIRSITSDDDGEYTCTAVNAAGEAVLVVAVVRDITAGQQMIQQRAQASTIQSTQVHQPTPAQVVRSSSTLFSDSQFYHNGSEQAFHVDTFEYRLLREDEFRESLLRSVSSSDTTEYIEVVHKSRPLASPQIQGRPRNSKLICGSDATFQVRVPGNPEPRVTWFKNGRRIQTSSRHIISYVDGLATLTIRNCQSDDAGYYTMLAENSKGRVATSVHLVIEDLTRYQQHHEQQQWSQHTTTTHVQATFSQDNANLYQAHTPAEYRLAESQQWIHEGSEDSAALKPTFVKLPCDKVITEGHQIRFDCRVTGRPAPEVLWFREGRQICDDNAHKILINEGGLHALQINDSKSSDAGIWTCIARNKSGECKADVRLTVIERELVVPPKFVERFQHTTIQEGDPVSLYCRAVGTPMPQLLWLKDGEQIHSTPPHVIIESSEGVSALHIQNAALGDGAWYQCTATNQAGSTATRARLHVEMLPRKLTEPWSLNLPPATTVIEPEKPIPSETVVLKHWEKPKAAAAAPAAPFREELAPQKPAFTSHLQDIVITEGDKAHFETRLIPIGDPTLTVEWFVNGRSVEASSRVMTVNRFGYVALTMLNAYPEDNGVYLCKARNQAGEATISASLNVLPRPAVETTAINTGSLLAIKELEEYEKFHQQMVEESGPQQKPTFIKPLENVEQREGGFSRFEAQLQPVNDPTMRVEWFFNGRPLTSSSRINTTFTFGYVVLTISSLRYEDSGVYMIKATNAKGDALSTATLKVVVEAQTTQFSGVDEQQRFIQQTQQLEIYRETQQKKQDWEEPEELSQPPVFITQPRDQQNVQEGKTVLFEARLEPAGDSSMRIEWFKDGRPLEASSRTQTMYSFGYVSLRISQVEERDSGVYVVTATNKLGSTSATASLSCFSTKAQIYDTVQQQQPKGLERIQHIEDYTRYDRKQEEDIYAITQRPRFVDSLQGGEAFIEGQSAHFETRLEPMGDPSMTVEWYHNGQPLTTGHRFKTYSDFGYVALDILHLNSEDSGTFTVVARNRLGEARLVKTVTVQQQTSIDTTSITDVSSIERTRTTTLREEVEDVSRSKPYFTVPLKDIQKPLSEGDNVFLECKVEPANDPTLRIEWLHNGRPLPSASRIVTKSDFGHVILQITGLTEQESGQYTVRATNHLGTTITSSSIKVIGKSGVVSESQYPEGLEKIQRLEQRQRRKEEDFTPTFGRPEFKKVLHNIETAEGINVHLECRLEPAQDPSLRVEWYKNDAPITVGHRFRPAHEFDYVALDILSAYSEDSGVYTCRAVNRQGEATTSSAVKVIATQELILDSQNPETLSQIESLERKGVRESYYEELLKTKPKFLSQPKPLSLSEGQTAHYECRLEPVNDPDLKVEWFKDGRQLPIGHRFRPFHDFGYVALNVLSVSSVDSGRYTCRATNTLGTAEVSTTLTATDGSNIITTSENPESISKIAQLEGHRFVREEFTDQAITTAPVFTSAPQNATVTEGQRSHFECRLIPVGDPKLKVEWFHNGQPVKHGSRFVELFNFGFVALDIMTTYAEDSGVYTCKATNALGEAVVSCSLNCAAKQSLILESQQPESLAQIRQLEDHSRHQRRSYHEEVQQQAPVFSNPMRNVSVKESHNAHFECRLTPLGDPRMKIEWFKNGMPLDQSSRITTISDFGFIALDVKGTKVEDTGTYTCRAVNEIGEAVCSAQLVVEGGSSLILESQQPGSLPAIQQLELGRPRAAKQEDVACKSAPRFVTQLTGPSQVTEGQSAHYECRLEPFPDATMKYEWLHNGKPLEQGHRFRTITDFGFIALDILSARPADSGEISIRATNKLGQAVSQARLKVAATGSLVLESQQPESLDAIRRLEGAVGYQRQEFIERQVTERPQFVRGLYNLENLVEGQSAHMEATLTPTSDPSMKVEWLHNGVPISVGSRHRLVNDFGYVALDINSVQPRDSGVYMCKATNKLGEAVTSSSVRVTGHANIVTESNISEVGLQRLRTLDQPVSAQPREEKPLPRVKPVFIQPLSSVDNLVDGQPIHLECRVEPINDPKLRVEWFVNGVEIKQGSRFRTTNDFGYVALDILHCYGEDSGTYMCKASNELGEAVTTCNVNAVNRRSLILDSQHPESVQKIQELESVEKWRRTTEIEEKPVSAPVFITELRGHTELVEGQTAHMECRVEPAHDSALKIETLHNGKPIRAANKTRITTDFGYVALDIAHVYPENSGRYTVRATNKLGSAETSLQVRVSGKSGVQLESLNPQSMQSIREIEGKTYKTEHEIATPVFQRPEFTQPLNNASLVEGQACTLQARLIPVGDPTTKIEWLLNDQPISEGSRIHTVQDFGCMQLTIDYVRAEDQGVYTCRATTSQGQAVTSSNVRVQAKEGLQLQSQQPQSLEAIRSLEGGKIAPQPREIPDAVFEKPVFTQLLSGPSEVNESAPVRMECRCTPIGDPDLKIQWFCNGNLIENASRMTFGKDFGFITLDVLSARGEDSGVYMCKASNKAGEAITTMSLRVKTRASVQEEALHPEAYRIMQQYEYELSRRAPEERPDVPMPSPMFVKQLSSVSNATEGQYIRLEGRIEPSKDSKIKVEWFKNQQPLTLGSRIKATHDFGMVSLDISNTRPDDSGLYVCRVSNESGEALSTCTIKVESSAGLLLGSLQPESLERIREMESFQAPAPRQIAEPVFEMPVFVSHVNDLELVEGQHARFECRVEPAKDPTLRIEVFQNQKTLRTGSRITTKVDFGLVTIDIQGVGTHDAGIYAVRAKNSKGEATTTASLKVVDRASVQLDTLHPTGAQGLSSIQKVEDQWSTKYQAPKAAPEKVFPKPVFTEALKPHLSVSEGQGVVLECRVEPSTDPDLSVEVFFNGTALSDANRFRWTNEFGYINLTVRDFWSRDSGVYTIRAKNKAGEAFTTTTIECVSTGSIVETTQHPEGTKGLESIQMLEESMMRTASEETSEEKGHAPVFTSQFANLTDLTEGEVAHFEAMLSPVGDQSMQVEWLFNGRSIEMGHRIRTVHAFGVVLLEILGVVIEDSGKYTCRARNKWGQAEVSVDLKCVDKQKGERPVFKKQLNNVSNLREGESVHMECNVTPIGDPDLRVEWFKNGKPLPDSSRIKTLSDFGFVVMDISYVHHEDSGEYVCVATNKYGSDTTKCTIECASSGKLFLESLQPRSMEQITRMEGMKSRTVTRVESTIQSAPKFTSHIQNVANLTEGQSAHFECQLTPINDPDLKIEWFVNGQLMRSGHRFRTFHDFGVVVLDILYCYGEDSGEWVCKATNKFGTDVTRATLSCKSKSTLVLESQLPVEMAGGQRKLTQLEKSLMRSVSTASVGEVQEAPVFARPLEDLTKLREGENAHFEARVTPTHDSDMTVEWFKDGKTLMSGTRIRTINDFGFVILEISPVYPEDSGTYMCKVRNRFGEAVSECTMRCEGKQGIISESQLPTGMRTGIQKIAQIEASRLTMQQTRTVETHEVAMGPPQFLSSPSDLSLTENGLAHFECRVGPANDPTLRVDWFHNGKPLVTGSRVKSISDFGYVILEIAGVFDRDAGVYTCRAVNKQGEASVNCQLNIKSKQSIVVESQLPKGFSGEGIKILEDSRLHQASKVVDEERKEAPKFVTQLSKTYERTEGDNAHFECKLLPVGDATMKVEWFVDGKPLITGSRVHTVDDFGFVVLEIDWLFPRDSGEYMCRATNKWGSDVTKCNLMVKGKANIILESQLPQGIDIARLRELENPPMHESPAQDRAITSPRFVTQIQPQHSLKEGDSAHFECRLEPTNDPKLRVEWFHNGKPLISGHRYKTTHDFGFVALDILYCYSEDSGEYVARAYSELGEDFTKAFLECSGKPTLDYRTQLPMSMKDGVKKIAEMEIVKQKTETIIEQEPERLAPMFVMKPEPQIVNEGDWAKFQCRVIGHPKPRLIWVLNGNTVVDGSRCKLTYDGIYHFDIPKSRQYDAGKVEVFARNAEGEAYCSTTLEVRQHQSDYRAVLKQSPNPWYDRDMHTYQVDRQKKEEKRVFEEVFPGGQQVDVWKTERTSQGEKQQVKQHLTAEELEKMHASTVTTSSSESLVEQKSSTIQHLSNQQRIIQQQQQLRQNFLLQKQQTQQQQPRPQAQRAPVAPTQSGQATASTVQGREVTQTVQQQTQKQYQGEVEVHKRKQVTERVEQGHKGVTEERMVSGPVQPSVSPKFVKKIQPCRAVEGESAQFVCEFTGEPAPEITWYRENFTIKNSKDFQIVTTSTKSTLTIREVYVEDSGVFSVKAENAGGSAKTSANLVVEERQEAGVGVVPPNFTKTIQSQRSKQGMNIKLAGCISGGRPMDIYWLRSGQKIVEDATHKIHEEADMCTLVILNATPEDSGNYECVALNKAGEARCIAQVVVEPSASGARSVSQAQLLQQQQTTDTSSGGPQVSEGIKDVTVKQGQPVIFRCRIPASPTAQVKWYRGDNLVKQSRYYKISGENHVYTLKILEAFPEDEGEYRCEATNRGGTASTTAHLKVVVSDGSEKPPVLGALSDISVEEGQPATFTTQLAGNPKPKVAWYQGGQVVRPTRDFQITQTDDSCSLLIKRALPADAGTYTCRATNAGGQAEASGKLTVMRKGPK